MNKKMTFWVGAGISKESGAPLAVELSNGIIHTLCIGNNDVFDKIYGNIPSALGQYPNPYALTLPLSIAPPSIEYENSSLRIFQPSPVNSLRLEVVLEGLRQALPDQGIQSIFNFFNLLEPNAFHYILAKALAEGHHVITTNWDRLIEKAGINLGANFDIKIWNPRTDNIQTSKINQGGLGILLKLHGSIEQSAADPVTFIHQFTIGAPESIQNLLHEILDKALTIFTGYSFSDYFDYTEIIRNFQKYNSKVFVIKHSENLITPGSWIPLSRDLPPLANIGAISKSGIRAHSQSFLRWLFNDEKPYPYITKSIMQEILEYIGNCSVDKKRKAIYWIAINLGKPNLIPVSYKSIKLNNRSDWYLLNNFIQANFLRGELNGAIKFLNMLIKKDLLQTCSHNVLIRVIELLERGLEIALSKASLIYAWRYWRLLKEIFQRIKLSPTISEEERREVYNRYNHIINNLNAVSRMVPLLNMILRPILSIPSANANISRTFFMLNILIYFERSEAFKTKNLDKLSQCYKSYLEMCNIDGALGTITDLASFCYKTDLENAIELLRIGNKIIFAETGSVYAKAKLYSMLSSLLLVQAIFYHSKYKGSSERFCAIFENYMKSIGCFDSTITKVAWAIRTSYSFFLRPFTIGFILNFRQWLKLTFGGARGG